jgi:outer membrane biosynthesis protein TonB
VIAIGTPKVKGDLDKAIIRRYIRRNMQKLQYCYEKELVKNDKLKGTVTVTFVIGAEGRVSSAAATGLKAGPEVERCYGNVIQAIQFPKPKGGEVSVVYPFTLRPR